MEKRDKIFWHAAHHEALQLELHEYADALEFQDEYPLSKEALRMDSLIIKKTKNVEIKKNIGRIFKPHNIVEFKSESDNFDIWDYEKLRGYAHIYAAFTKTPIADITLTISLTIYPRELIKTLENERKLSVEKVENGIYYIKGDIFPIQILESKNLNEEENRYLSILRSNLNLANVKSFIQEERTQSLLNEKSVLMDRIIKANPETFKEAFNMHTEALRNFFLEHAEENGWLDDHDKEIAREAARETARETAREMLRYDIPPDKVAKITKLSLETVLSLSTELDPIPAGA